MKKITPFLWFNTEAEDAMNFYLSIFKNAKPGAVSRYGDAGPGPKGSVMVASFDLAGQTFSAINGGPHYKINHAMSFFVQCETPEEIDAIWSKLSAGGTPFMPLDKYPFSERYGWIQDKFGVSWQLNLTHKPQSISPALLFAGKNQGNAEEAINLYTSLFPNSSVNMIARYEASEHGPTDKIKYSNFTLNGQEFVAMDSGNSTAVDFTPGTSLFVSCENQAEVDKFWDTLSENGRKDQCGWLQDKFGLSWQIIPEQLITLMTDKDPKKSGRVMKAMMKMHKIVIGELQSAYDGEEVTA